MGHPKKTSDAARKVGVRILIADDNLVNQNVILAYVENMGYEADVVTNGVDALDALASVPYALVLMDCQMPVMDGITATVQIRRREGGNRHTPIIAVTANGNRERCLDAGMDDYLAKPVRQQQLADAIARWIPQQPPKNSSTNGNGTSATSEARTLPSAHTPLEEAELNGTATAENVDAFSDAKISQRLSQLSEECGAEMLSGFIGMFVRDTAERLNRLHGLAAQQDVTAVEREAHNLKGSCANLGAERMAAFCHQLETEAEAGSLGSANEFLEQLDSEFERLKPLLGWETQVL